MARAEYENEYLYSAGGKRKAKTKVVIITVTGDIDISVCVCVFVAEKNAVANALEIRQLIHKIVRQKFEKNEIIIVSDQRRTSFSVHNPFCISFVVFDLGPTGTRDTYLFSSFFSFADNDISHIVAEGIEHTH